MKIVSASRTPEENNRYLEALHEEGWRLAPWMTCPNGHEMKCHECAREHGHTRDLAAEETQA